MPPKSNYICFYRPSPAHSLLGLAGRGDAEAQAALGRLYLEGRPATSHDTYDGDEITVSSFTPAFPRDRAEAASWLQKAADQGHAAARRLLDVVRTRARGIH